MTGPDPFVVAICYPREWWGEPGAFDRAIEDLQRLDAPDGRRVEVIVAPYEEDHARRTARGVDPGADWTADQPPIPEATRSAFARMHAALVIDLPAGITGMAPDVLWIQAIGAGVDQLLSCRLNEAGVRLASSAGSNAVGIAEFALGRVIEHTKRFAELRQRQAARTWEPLFGRELAGMTLGLIGYGNIGRAIADRARAFGMEVLATRATARAGDAEPDLAAVFPPDALNEMLGSSDAVVAAVPDSPTTRGLMNAGAFAAMKPGAFFCNVGRGSLVDEDALVEALTSGQLGGAALDVFSTEPLPADHPLWSAPNTSLSFHNAAAPSMFGNVHRIFADNVRNHLAGRPLVNLVTDPGAR